MATAGNGSSREEAPWSRRVARFERCARLGGNDPAARDRSGTVGRVARGAGWPFHRKMVKTVPNRRSIRF